MKYSHGIRALCFAFLGAAAGLLPSVGWASTLLVASGNTVGSYNPNTGAPFNESLIAGVTSPVGLAVTGSHLLVSSVFDDTIGKYEIATGSAVSSSFISDIDPLALAVSGTDLFVSHYSYTSIAKFNASTGSTINLNFITSGAISVYGMAVSDAGLLVSDAGYYQVRRFNPATGAFIDAFITDLNDPRGIAVSGNDLYVVNSGSNTVGKYNATTGEVIDASFINFGLNSPYGIAATASDLYITNQGSDKVMRFDAVTGSLVDGNFITGLSDPTGIAIAAVPEPSTCSVIALLLTAAFGTFRRRGL